MTELRDVIRQTSEAVRNGPVGERRANETARVAFENTRRSVQREEELRNPKKPCNICGGGWPNHDEACVYVENARKALAYDKLRTEVTAVADSCRRAAWGSQGATLLSLAQRLDALVED